MKINERQHIVVLTRSSRFPNGMAASQRITMIGRMILSKGDVARVLCLLPTETEAGKVDSKGEHFGIKYEFTAGTALRSSSFLVRQWHQVKGSVIGLCKIAQYKIRGEIDVIYIYDRAYNLQYLDLFFIAYARLLGIPVIREMNERPWALKTSPSFAERFISPLCGVNGVIAISSLIKQWVESESARRRTVTSIAHIPILTDVNEAVRQKDGTAPCYVLFAGSPMYDETITYIIDAMDVVWRSFPACRLYLTGFKADDEAGRWITKECRKRAIEDNVMICGYLSRNSLLEHYTGAKALLIPLFDDIRSKARFPTKIGEYLASSVPIITNMIGEIPYYFKDGENALIAEPGDPTAYAEKIIECLGDAERSRRIGHCGRIVAEMKFHYESYADTMSEFLQEVGQGRRYCSKHDYGKGEFT